MRIAFYIEQGLEQIILTPESEYEQDMLSKLHEGDRQVAVKSGEFYHCRGGWVRQRGSHQTLIYGVPERNSDESTMLVITPKAKASD